MDLAGIGAGLSAHGLIVCGGFHPGPGDGVPGGGGTLVMVGNAGPAMWAAFAAAGIAGEHPLDAWTRAVVGPLAARAGARALYPFDGPPYLPFQRWAMRSEAVFPSPIGALIHPVYGLWHAYRAALVFEDAPVLAARADAASPCESCRERPCLTACPVAALGPGRYDVAACVDHLEAPAGADCRGLGCRARRACPVGRDFVHAPPQARFHMDAFARAQRRGAS